MKNAKFSDAQIMAILRQAENGVPVSELCREHGMSRASFYKWRAKFGGMDASMVSALTGTVQSSVIASAYGVDMDAKGLADVDTALRRIRDACKAYTAAEWKPKLKQLPMFV